MSAHLYMIEELGDARLRCDQLVRYINEAVKLIEKSPKRDHFFEEAGHLIEGIPAVAFRLEKALQATALAAGKLDYEELKQELRPEKVQQLEKVLEEVRIRPVHRRSEPIMDVQQAIEALQKLASQTRESGSLSASEALSLITDLEVGLKTANTEAAPADVLDKITRALSSATPYQRLSRARLAGLLRRLVADEMVRELLSEESLTKEAAEEMATPDVLVEEMLSTMKAVARSAGVGRWRVALLQLTGIVEGIGNLLAQMGDEGALVKTQALAREVMQAARMAQRMRPEDMVPVMAGDKTSADPMRAMERMLDTTKDQLKEMEHSFELIKKDEQRYAPQIQNFAGAVHSLMSAGRMVDRALSRLSPQEYYGKHGSEDETKESRFEEGKPADPTKNMDKDDALKWKSNTDKYEDKFKSAGVQNYSFYVDRLTSGLMKLNKINIFQTLEIELADTLENLDRMSPPTEEHLVRKGRDAAQKLKRVSKTLLDATIDASNIREGVVTVLERDTGIRLASDEEEKEARFEEGKPADPTKQMSPEDAKKWKAENEKHKDEFKSAADWKVSVTDITHVPEDKEEWAKELKGHLEEFKKVVDGLDVPYKQASISNIGGAHRASLMIVLGLDPKSEWKNGIRENSYFAHVRIDNEKGKWVLEAFSGPAAKGIRKVSTPDKDKLVKALKELPQKMEAKRPSKTASDPWKVDAKEDEEKEARFEEGKPADPTKQMNPEDAKKWKDNTEEYGDKFKAAAAWKVSGVGNWYMIPPREGTYDSYTVYFYAFELLKNSSLRCMSMEVGPSGRTRGNPKLIPLDARALYNMQMVRESEVPKKVTTKVLPAVEKYKERKQKEEAEAAEKLEKVKDVNPPAKITSDELKALSVMMQTKPGYRDQAFRRKGLGEYGPHNIHIASLVKRGIVTMRGNALVIDKSKALRAFLDNKDVVQDTDFGVDGLPYTVRDRLREASWKA